ncbi:uncharacterized protein PFL1_03469 [Pseudozyma flocculosa PF-1]|uniref:Related to VBA1 - Vacuolar Basic Amino acid transporter n=2 Tax=Pseudozyma flocculosa TaxID=84751 RepID=A0A5C3FD14_9BASI|nr:uncharacterized protein PFL1_03469 [Pseudozyma flocculosa PF-1]EPQ29182.1 hypothetical protein PFL1_03469 [Pseudozyma flocculosa PF-1]SPO41517.1 related to VBA1 - Vacuolar Basic Amino acid transporter [Pseudozyma flocculosa]
MSPPSRTDERTALLSDNHANGRSYGNAADGTSSATSTPETEHRHVEVMPPLSVLAPVMVALWVPVFVASLDGTIVATLLSSISSSFNASEQAAWLGSSYLLSVCCFTPIYGRLADIVGRKACLLTALTFFTVGTALCGVSTSMEMLIASRAIAGMGGGGLTTTSSVIMSDLVPLKNRGLLQGLTNIIFGLGSGLGGPVGGWMNDTLGWRKAFLLQLPFLALAYVLASCFVNIKVPVPSHGRTTMEKIRNIDFLGSVSLVVGVSSTLISLSMMSANDRTIDEPIVWGGLVLGAVSTVFFFYAEKHLAPHPVLPLKLITQRTGGAVAASNLFLSIAAFATLYNFPLFFQAVKLQTASEAGLHLIPNSIGLSLGSVLAGIYMRQTGRYYWYNLVHALLTVLSIGTICFFGPQTPEWLTYLVVVPNGFGTAGVLTCTLIALINSVPRAEVAVATSCSYLSRTSGQVLGVSFSGTLLQALLKDQLRKRIHGEGAEDIISRIRHQSHIVAELPPHLRQAAVESYSFALRWVFVGIAVVSLCTAISSSFIEDKVLPDFEKAKKPTADDREGLAIQGR